MASSTEVSGPEVFRPRSGLWLAGLAMAVAGLGVVSLLISRDVGAIVRFGPLLLLAGALAWAMFWRPNVEISDGGVHLRNVLRTVELPWPAIRRIDTRFALTLETAWGTYTAWAAPTSTSRTLSHAPSDLRALPETSFGQGDTVRPGDLPGSPSGDAAALVRRRWEVLRDAGHLDDPRLEQQRPTVRWHTLEITVLGVLALGSVLGLVLGGHS